MKLGSLFDGSGGFPLAGALCNITPVWASEVEPYPIAVTKNRLPNMRHLGDVSKINGANIEPVDIITFGSPCQDLSVAGRRAGLKHEDNGDEETTRSGLFMEAVRIIKEMRGATNGEYPKIAMWENVPGAFSSNKGEDFRTVLEELIKIVEPNAVMPDVPKKGWAYADCYRGNGWSIAYRVLDAQYIRTAQRRRRIYLVLCLTNERAGEILFKRESLRGNTPQSGTPRQSVTADVKGSVGADDREGTCLSFHLTQDPITSEKCTPCITSGNPISGQASVGVVVGYDGYNGVITGDKVVTLGTNCDRATGRQGVCYSIENHPNDSRVKIDDEGKVQALTGRMGTGGGNVPMVLEKKTADRCENPVICLQGNGIDRKDTAGCNGSGMRSGVERDVVFVTAKTHYIVRRLTPTECARLQGFPDTWGNIQPKSELTDEEYEFWLGVRNTHAAINGKIVKDYTKKQMLTWYNKLWTDSAECKMWGNGIALPCALYVMQGIAEILNENN